MTLGEIKEKINWKSPKYVIPAPFFPLLLYMGYAYIDIKNDLASKEEVESALKDVEGLNTRMPNSYGSDLMGKSEGVNRKFDDLRDKTAVMGIEDDLDSLTKKEEYQSQYDAANRNRLNREEQQRQTEFERRKKLLERQANGGRDQSPDEFLGNPSQDDLFRSSRKRGEKEMQEYKDQVQMMRDLGLNYQNGVKGQIDEQTGRTSGSESQGVNTGLVPNLNSQPESEDPSGRKSVKSLGSDSKEHTVFKKVPYKNPNFNTIGDNKRQSSVIKAIIDENIKAVDGSRVRLRLLDDIEVSDVTIKKGSYLYCTMSGFGSQRVHGTVESVMVGDELYRISLTLYDTDGIEGLYVPESQFRETSKEVGSQALSNDMDVTSNMNTGSNIAQWTTNAIKQAYQGITNAISKHIKKNKAHLKYGTQVLLLNGNSSAGSKKNRNATSK